MKRIVLAAALLVSVLLPVSLQAQESGQAPARMSVLPLAYRHQPYIPEGFDEYCQKTYEEWHIPGMAVVVVKDGRIVYLKGFGKTKWDGTGKDIDPETTQFVLASNTKAFTGALLATVVDDGEVSWTDPVIKHLPDFKLYDPWATENIQVREVNAHLVGWKENSMDDLPLFGYTRDDIYHILGSVKPTWSFRSTYSYNNEMYSVSAKIIEKYTGLSWDDAMAERIFKPLGMTHSTTGSKAYWSSPDLAGGYLIRYDYDNGKMDIEPREDREDGFAWLSALAPAAFVMSTASDMAAWLEMNLSHGMYKDSVIISKTNHDYLFKPQNVSGFNDGLIRTYGQGWGVEQNEKCRYIRHTGHAYGYTSIVGMVPEIDMGFAILTTNGTTSDAQAGIGRKLVDMYLGVNGPDYAHDNLVDFIESRRPKASKPDTAQVEEPQTLPSKKYAGTYFLQGFGEARVTEKDGKLNFALCKVDTPLKHVSGDTFKFHVDGAGWFDLTFKVENGKAKSFSFVAVDETDDFIRKSR